MIKNLLNFFRGGTGDLDYILEPVQGLPVQELLKAALAADSPHVGETIRRISEVLYGQLPDDRQLEARRLLISVSSQLFVFLQRINTFFELPPAPIPPPDPNPIPPTPPAPPPVSPLIRPGIWVANGHPGDTIDQMYSWSPTAITCIDEYLGPNQVHKYKAENPDTTIIVRFIHPQNWQQNPAASAKDLANRVVSKWAELKPLDPYIYYANEMNLHYENGDQDAGRQHLYETPEFYGGLARWVQDVAEQVKNAVPDLKLVCPPFAYGHFEDGAPDDNGIPKEGWAGYDFFQEVIRVYFDNVITGHYYWGDGRGRVEAKLYDPEEASWHAFRWRRVLKLFKARYDIEAKIIIDEAGCFNAGHPEFANDVIYYANECLSDPRVLALTYFLWLDPTNSPGNLPNSWVQGMSADGLAALTQRLGEIWT